ncbi:sulfate/thiosulfate ABC transporter ATP-binding protein CysA [Oceanisphaera pacifica]|uniref:Sulfate/thiosulfate ABC transporter ATP-binding protein CysA n=1 Tax=Oceanisphaera pacifica TaxID=2818389 RepID=A0ABS3NH45_9GAMM|nr:sulfate/thiosulfate ABC transporter ATP-binding protein CysA [Oceanisphaera pacifica]MBO1519556.1 sulfate/thiosulfate ABC transporter ATP-binding protein CysA [Oceanisphaera pacifica]
MSIQIEGIHKSFGKTQVLHDINLDLLSGQLVGLLGPSGSGKTTLLRIIAGLEHANGGRIRFNGEDVTDLHARDRNVGFVFQNYALFRHMTVFDNIAFGLSIMPKAQRPEKSEIKRRVNNLLEMIQLAHVANRFPAQLSGGQRQRVALARSLAVEPKVLLLDEPFGALDAQVRKELRRWLRRLHDELHFTSVFVTHDQEEALDVSDQVVVMSQGHVEQIGTPDAIWQAPASRFVLEFLGEVNKINGDITGSRFQVGHYPLQIPVASHKQGAASWYLRPHEISLTTAPDVQHPLPVLVTDVNARGSLVQLELEPKDWPGTLMAAQLTHQHLTGVTRGQTLYLGSQGGRLYVGEQQITDSNLALTA